MSYPPTDPRSIWAYMWFNQEPKKQYCPKCGATIKPTYKYCPKCGHKLKPNANKLEKQKKDETETNKALAIIYLLSVLIGSPIIYILFAEKLYDQFWGFNFVLFAFLTLSIGAFLGFLCLATFAILAKTARKVKQK